MNTQAAWEATMAMLTVLGIVAGFALFIVALLGWVGLWMKAEDRGWPWYVVYPGAVSLPLLGSWIVAYFGFLHS